jgi:hypothetical protein
MTEGKNVNTDLEYKISEGTEAPSLPGSTVSDSGVGNVPLPKAPSRMKKFLLVPVFLIIVFSVYKFLGWYYEKPQDTTPKTVVTQPKVAAPIAAMPQAAAPSPEVISLMQQNQSNREELDKMTESVNKTQSTLDAMQNKIDDLTQSVNQLSVQNESLKAMMHKPKVKKIVKHVAQKMESYHIKAIVPGRVWLESDSGKVVTLRVGDSLAGYGMIQLISPQQGLVMTSSGMAIQYGVNDF